MTVRSPVSSQEVLLSAGYQERLYAETRGVAGCWAGGVWWAAEIITSVDFMV